MRSFKGIGLAFIGLVLYAFNSLAQEVGKQWDRTYPVKQNSTLDIDNQYGKIDVKTWNEKQIKVTVAIILKGKSESKLQAMLEEISIADQTQGNAVKLATQFGKKNMKNMDIAIDYTVLMPSSIPLTLANSFGDIALANLDAETRIKLGYGSIKGGRLNALDNKLDIEFSKGVFDAVVGGELNISYSSMEVDELGSIVAKTSFSQIEIDRAEVLDVHSQYDSYEIDGVNSLLVVAAFSSFEVGVVEEIINADLSYTGFEVRNMGTQFKSVAITSEMGGVDLGMEACDAYAFDLKTEMAGIKLPKRAALTEKIEKDMGRHYKGAVGKGSNRTVKIATAYGEINIDQ